MSSMGGMGKLAEKRSNFVALCLLTLIFLFGMPIVGEVEAKWMKSSGFFAISDSPMMWKDAIAYCQHKGGRLPLINGAASLSVEQVRDLVVSSEGLNIEGFGFIKGGMDYNDWTTPLPSDLVRGLYWLGTVHPDHSDRAWFVEGQGRAIFVDNSLKGYALRVVCVR